MRKDFDFLPGGDKNKDKPAEEQEKFALFRFNMQFYDVVHPILTHGEAWCLATMPNTLYSLKVLKIYMYAGAMVMEQPRPLDEQGTLSYASALVRGDEELFHWLNAFRAATNESKTERARAPSQLVRDASRDVSAGDAEQAKFDSKRQFLGIEEVQQRILILTDKEFIPSLIETAASIDDNFATSGKLLQLIHLMMSERIVLTSENFRRMHLLDAGFFDFYCSSTAFEKSSEEFKKHIQDIVDKAGDAGEGIAEGTVAEDEKWSDPVPFLCHPEEKAPAAAASAEEKNDVVMVDMLDSETDSDDESIPAPLGEPVDQIQIELDDETVLRVFQVARESIRKKQNMKALRMIMQLKPVLSHTEEKLRQRMPMLFDTKMRPHNFNFEFLRPEVPNPCRGVQPGMKNKSRTFAAIGNAFGIPLEGKAAHVFSAVWQQRLFIEGRSSAEILHPLNLQHNMYSTDLLFLSVDLVKILCIQLGESGEELLQGLSGAAGVIHERDPDTLQAAHVRKRYVSRIDTGGKGAAASKLEVQGSTKKQRNKENQTASSAKAPVSSHSPEAGPSHSAMYTGAASAPFDPTAHNAEAYSPSHAGSTRSESDDENPASPKMTPERGYGGGGASASAAAAAQPAGSSHLFDNMEEEHDFMAEMGIGTGTGQQHDDPEDFVREKEKEKQTRAAKKKK